MHYDEHVRTERYRCVFNILTVWFFIKLLSDIIIFYYVYTRANFYGFKNNTESSKRLILKT